MSKHGSGGGSEFERWLERKSEKKERANGLRKGGLRRSSELRRTGNLKRTRLNPVSKKQKKRNHDYNEARKRHYADETNRICAICGTNTHLSVHHAEGRGRNTADETTFITLCVLGSTFDVLHPELNSCNGQGCHQGVHANMEWARQNGYMK